MGIDAAGSEYGGFLRVAFPDLHPLAERWVDEAHRQACRPGPDGWSPWDRAEAVAACNVARVLQAFHAVGASEGFLAGSTGYGYSDPGRAALERAYAMLFGGEAALVRPQLVSGTHALACALFGLLRPGQELLVATGLPYDTLWPVLGIEGRETGSLAEWGIQTRVHPLAPDGSVDIEGLVGCIGSRTRAVLVQRSRGYSWRPSLSVEAIGRICRAVHEANPDVAVVVDNAYGEFVEVQEPGHAGADLVAGSLIKNPGGGLAPSGGYLVGKAELVERAAARLTAPGLAAEVGPGLGVMRWLWMGLFCAPHAVGEMVAGAILAAFAFQAVGLPVSPLPQEPRTDIVQAVQAASPRAALAIVRGIQRASALDASALPHPARLPGYRDPIVMAGGTFVQGSSSELSADVPMRPPYNVFLQGGLSRHHVALGVARALHELLEEGLVDP